MSKENFSLIIYSTDRIQGVYNYDAYYNVNWDNLFKKKFNNHQLFKVRWYMASKSKINIPSDNLALLFIDFSTKINQQDSKLNNNVTNLGIVKINNNYISSNGYYYLTNLNEYETITISKPTSNIIRVFFRNCDNTEFFNGSSISNYNLPDFYIKLEFEVI